jgi:hypothetical protein
VDAVIDNVSDEDLLGKVDVVLGSRWGEKFRDYLQDMLDQEMTGTPDKLVRRALAKVSAARKAKKNRFADDHDDDAWGED